MLVSGFLQISLDPRKSSSFVIYELEAEGTARSSGQSGESDNEIRYDQPSALVCVCERGLTCVG